MTSSTPLSILAVGAHMDDCWLGMGGTALKAVSQGHKVTMVTAVSNYRHLPHLKGRDEEINGALKTFHGARNVQLIQLGLDYMRLHNEPALVERLAGIIHDVKPDMVFTHAEDERNLDHPMIGAASRTAAIHWECFLDQTAAANMKWIGEIYQFTTGWQATDFSPDTFVDITDVIFEALDACTFFDDLYAKGNASRELSVTAPPQSRSAALTAHSRFKFGQSIVFGNGHGYAEGFKAYTRVPLASRKLARII